MKVQLCKAMALRGLVERGSRTAVPCPGDQVSISLARLLGQGSLPEMIHSAARTVLAKGMCWRTWAVLKTCQRSNNLLRELISAVNYPCDQNESPTVLLKSGFCLSNLCPVLFSRDMDSWLFPSSLQYPAIHLNNFVLFSQYFSRSSNQVLFLFPWRPRKHCLKNLHQPTPWPSLPTSHPHVGFRPKRLKKKKSQR